MSFYDRDNFFPDTSVGYLVKVCNQLGMANLDQAFAADEPSAVQWSALISIHFGMGATCAALARHMAHDKGAMTRMIDTLEERGWVARERDDTDRRQINLTLTRAGRDMAMRCRDKAIGRWNAWLVDWTDTEIADFIAHLQKLRRTLEAPSACVA